MCKIISAPALLCTDAQRESRLFDLPPTRLIDPRKSVVQRPSSSKCGTIRQSCAAVQSQNAVSAYFTSKQTLPFCLCKSVCLQENWLAAAINRA